MCTEEMGPISIKLLPLFRIIRKWVSHSQTPNSATRVRLLLREVFRFFTCNMESKQLVLALRGIIGMQRAFGVLPITYNKTTNEFCVTRSKLYIAVYNVRLLVAVSFKFVTIASLIHRIFITKTFDLKDQASVMQLFYFLPISIYSFSNIYSAYSRTHQMASLLNTFLSFYGKYQGMHLMINIQLQPSTVWINIIMFA